MELTQRSINVEKEYWNRIPANDRSQIVRKLIKDYVCLIDNESGEIDMELLNVEIIRLQNESIKITSQLTSKKTQRDTIIRQAEQVKEDNLKIEKERMEQHQQDEKKANSCLSCGHPTETMEKVYPMPKGKVCKPCYLAASANQIKAWGME